MEADASAPKRPTMAASMYCMTIEVICAKMTGTLKRQTQERAREIEGLLSFWPISEITIADRGIREGILLDLMHAEKQQKKRKKFRPRYPFSKKYRRYMNNNHHSKKAVNDD